MRYRDTTLSTGQIAQELSAGSILEGSVRKAGNRVRITAQLIHGEADKHLWSQSYDRELTDVFAIQADIAEKVAEALKIQLLSKEKKSIERKATDSPEAYALYLKGRYHWNERSEVGAKTAIKSFEEAIKADPDFAAAYSGLADAYLIMVDYGWMDPAEVGPLGIKYAKRALELDDSLAEAHASLGLALVNLTWEFGQAEKELKRAVELRPNYAEAYHWYAILLTFLSRHKEADEMEKRAREIDPHSRTLGMATGVSLFYMRRYDEAIEALDRVIGSNPDFSTPHFWKCLVLMNMRRFEEAIEEGKKAVDLDKGSPQIKANLAWAYARAGDKESATRLLNEAMTQKGGHISPAWTGVVMFALGRRDEAFTFFQKAFDGHDSAVLYLRGAPGFEDVKSDPRWIALEKKMGQQE
jgi:adenylate cyclase